MPNTSHPTRRRVLQLTAGTAALGLAGCLGAPASTEPSGSSGGGSDDERADDGHADEEPHAEETPHDEPAEHGHEPTEHDTGHGHGHDDDDVVEGPNPSAVVRMTSSDAGEHFEPHVVWVEAGGTVTWVNESGAHSATAYHPDNDRPLLMPEAAEAFDSGVLVDAGAEYSRTFDVEGVYHVYCAPHEGLGMLGSVIVGEPDAHGQPALEEIPHDLPGTAPEKLEHLNEKCNEALGHTH